MQIMNFPLFFINPNSLSFMFCFVPFPSVSFRFASFRFVFISFHSLPLNTSRYLNVFHHIENAALHFCRQFLYICVIRGYDYINKRPKGATSLTWVVNDRLEAAKQFLQIRAWQPYLLIDEHEKSGRGHWVLASCKVW